jgi:hypothetical protein
LARKWWANGWQMVDAGQMVNGWDFMGDYIGGK